MITPSKRRFLLFFLIVIVFIIILGSSYLFILNSQPLRDYLKPIIVRQLENNLGKSVHIEEIQSVSFNSLVLSNLIILENTAARENITLLEAERVTINFRITLSFPQFKNWQLAITQLTLQKANLNLQRDIQGDLDMVKNLNLQPEMIKAPNLDLQLDGEIKIQGDLPQPAFAGQLTVGKGYFLFLEQKFQFSEGKLLLNEFTGPDVLLDIKANTKVNQVTVFLKISGNLSAPQISLSSSPALSEAEIISLLTLNKNISGLSEGETGELLRGEIFNLIFQGLSVNFLRRAENQIANYLGLDVFRIETIFTENSETTPFYDLKFKTFGVEVGKSITEDLFLTYSTSLDGFSEKSFTAEINTYELEKSGTEIKIGLQFEF